MYSDPRHLKDREIKLRVDEDTYNLISAIARFNRTQKAVLVRELVEAQLEKIAAEEGIKDHVAA